MDEEDEEKPKRKLKVVDKPRSKGNAKGKIKSILKGYFYVFAPVQEEAFSTEIHKIKHSTDNPGNPKPEETYTVTNDSCSCPAGSNNVECKHVEMVQGRFRGNEFKREEALDLMEEWLDEVKEKGSMSTATGELAYGDRVKVMRADCLVYSTSCQQEIIMFLEYKGLLIRNTCLPTEALYKRRLSEARIAWINRRKLI